MWLCDKHIDTLLNHRDIHWLPSNGSSLHHMMLFWQFLSPLDLALWPLCNQLLQGISPSPTEAVMTNKKCCLKILDDHKCNNRHEWNMVISMLEDTNYFRKLQCRKLANDFIISEDISWMWASMLPSSSLNSSSSSAYVVNTNGTTDIVR